MTDWKTKAEMICFFGNGHVEAGSELKNVVGGKGDSIWDMTRAGLLGIY